MRIIFSRKGFDLGSGKAPSPIIDGRPISLPIPTSRRSHTRYADLGLGNLVEKVTRRKLKAEHLCHHDPMFVEDYCLFGQCGIAQSHLQKQQIGVGDVFLFFGLFSDERTGELHHRIFGYLQIAESVQGPMALSDLISRFPNLHHPHLIGEWSSNNCIYIGEGTTARTASDRLRLTQKGGPLRHWILPAWIEEQGMTYHGSPRRWLGNGRLEIVSRGQEFVVDTQNRCDALRWLDSIIEEIRL